MLLKGRDFHARLQKSLLSCGFNGLCQLSALLFQFLDTVFQLVIGTEELVSGEPSLGLVLNAQKDHRTTVFIVNQIAGVQFQYPSAEPGALVLEFEDFGGTVMGNDFAEQGSEPGLIPSTGINFKKAVALNARGGTAERAAKRRVGGDHPQICVEDKERVTNGIDNTSRECPHRFRSPKRMGWIARC
nr:hypothetical protein [Zavarzinella formosa]